LECEFFGKLEREITAFVRDSDGDLENNNSVTYSFDCTYQRMLCHGICQYYGLESRSKSINEYDDDDNKIVIVKKKSLTCIPNETLSSHLRNAQN